MKKDPITRAALTVPATTKAATCVFTLLIAGLILVACTPTLPTFGAVRDETREAMQEIIDLLPPEIDVNDASTETPFNCSGAGAMYTGLWRAYGDETFDPDAFVDSLPEGPDEDWSLDEKGTSPPQQHARHSRRTGGWTRHWHPRDLALRSSPGQADLSKAPRGIDELPEWGGSMVGAEVTESPAGSACSPSLAH